VVQRRLWSGGRLPVGRCADKRPWGREFEGGCQWFLALKQRGKMGRGEKTGASLGAWLRRERGLDVACARAKGGPTASGDDGGGWPLSKQRRRAAGGITVARGLAVKEGKWAGPRETVSGGGGKLIRIQNSNGFE
jgi:hypothetical protein